MLAIATMNGMAHPTDGMPRNQAPSGDFQIVHLPEASPSGSSFLLLSLENMANELSHEEAVDKLKHIMVQNAELRETALQLKQSLQSAYHCIRDSQSSIEQERNEVAEKYQQTRDVVTKLQIALKQKDATIKLLEKQAKQVSEQYQVKLSGDGSLNQLVLNLQQQTRELEMKAEKSRQEMESTTLQLNNLKTLHSHLSQESTGTQLTLTGLREHVAKLKAENEIMSVNNAKLIDSLRASEGEMTRLKLERRNSRGSLETTAPLSREWINPREELSSSPGAKQRHNQQQEVSSMREQIVSLMAELKEAHSKSEALNTEKQDIILRLNDVEKKCQQQHQDLKQTRLDDDTLIQTLRNNIKELEEKINSHKSNTHRLNMAMEDNQCRYTQLCTDYHQLLQEYENYKMSSLTLTQKRELEEKVDNLTAQLVTAEEALNTKDRLVRDLNQSQRQSQADLNTLGLYQTQAELYKQDFEDERNAHLKLQKDNEKLKKENQQSKVTLKQLQDQLMEMTHSQLGMAQTPHQRIRLPYQPPNSATAYPQASHSGLNTDASRDQAPGIIYPPSSQYTTAPRYHYPTLPPNHRPWNAPGNGFDQCDADIKLTGPDRVRNVDLDSIEASSTAPGHTGPVGPPLNKDLMLGPNKGNLQTVPGNTGPVNFQPAVKLSTSQEGKMFTVSKASGLMISEADRKNNADADKSGIGQVAVSQAYKFQYDEGTKMAVERIDLPEGQQKVEEEKQRSSAPDDPRSGGDLACPNCSLLHRDIDTLNDHLELCLELTF